MLILGEIVLGFLLLFIGGEAIVRSAIKISEKLNISKALVGLTIVSYATSAPEMLISVIAALDDHHEIALGNVIGSNITNTLLIFGLCAIIQPVKITKKSVNFDFRYLLIANIALILFSTLGVISRFEGFMLFVMLIIYTYVTGKLSYKSQDLLQNDVDTMQTPLKLKLSLITAFGLLILSVALLVGGSKLLVMGCVSLALKFDIPQSVIAVTVIAIGGSAPEISTSVIASLKKHSDLAVSNIIGSNIFNILGVIGITSLVNPISTISTTLSSFDIWIMLASALVIFAIGYYFNQISKKVGAFLLFLYLSYLCWEISLIL
ncbi:MAG: sodium:calcium antiporter [Rickettsiales bacterium]|nr:sodium:calcium antiporter [Rickettsiales bacterium]